MCLLRRTAWAAALTTIGLTSALAAGSSPAAAAPAQDLSSRIQCDGDVLSIVFSWVSSGDGQQWLDIGIDQTFAAGTFTGTGPLSPGRDSLDWPDPRPATTYYVRVNTYNGSAWFPSPTLSFTTPLCGAVPVSAAMLDLQASLEQQIATVGFQTAVAVTDLQTGETISVNGSRQQFAGCTMNLYALIQAVIDVEMGLYDESLVGDLISATVYGSNPVTAYDILLVSGHGDIAAAMNKINGLIETMGLTDTFYDHPPAYWPAHSLRGLHNLTTALDVNVALTAMWNGAVMSFESRDYLFEKMTGVKLGLNYLIPAGVSDGVVGHKNGFLVLPEGWIDNDAGIVTFQRGDRTYAYAITFLTQEVPTKYGDIPLGQTVSSMVWQYFSAKYP